MNTFRSILEIKPFADEAVEKIFKALFRVELHPAPHPLFFAENEYQVIGIVGLTGQVKGLICLRLSKRLAQELTSRAIPYTMQSQFSTAEVNDSISEITNILAGYLSPYLLQVDLSLRLSLPTLVRGIHLDLESLHGAMRYPYFYSYGDEVVILELYLAEDPQAHATYVPKILVIDRDLGTRAYWNKAFRPYLCQLIEAENEEKGLALGRSVRPELILMDKSTIKSSVIKALQAIKQNPETQACPVIILTQETSMEEMNLVMSQGALYYLTKDFKYPLILDIVVQKLRLESKIEIRNI